jgi:hypothetical protein
VPVHGLQTCRSPMLSGGIARDFGSSSQTLDWLKLYWFDLATLTVATTAVTRFWWAYFEVGDRAMLMVLAAAALIDVVRRAVAARRAFLAPTTFCGERRRDLVAAILLAVGPWPILPTLRLPTIDAAWPVATQPIALLVAAVVIGAIVISIVVDRIVLPNRLERFAVRELSAVPALHVASLWVLPSNSRSLNCASS